MEAIEASVKTLNHAIVKAVASEVVHCTHECSYAKLFRFRHGQNARSTVASELARGPMHRLTWRYLSYGMRFSLADSDT